MTQNRVSVSDCNYDVRQYCVDTGYRVLLNKITIHVQITLNLEKHIKLTSYEMTYFLISFIVK